MTDVQRALRALADEKYRDFHAALIPNVPKERILGVRTPVLRKFAREFAKTPGAEAFVRALPHDYYEENNLHMMLICFMRDFDEAVRALDEFLPYVDNWATCDMPAPVAFNSRPEGLWDKALEWLESRETYTVRYALGTLMRLYLDSPRANEALTLAAGVRSEEYYVNMMVAWLFATALAKDYETALPYISEHRLDKWTHNKAIQKAIESFRVTDEQKTRLRELKIK